MSRRFRSYELIFGNPVILDDDYFIPPLARGTSVAINLETYYNQDSPNAYLIDEHEISFKVTKSIKKTNRAEVSVTNLSESARNYLITNKNKNLVVILKVGYDGNNKLLFQGILKNSTSNKTGENAVTTLTMEDGSLNTKNSYSSRVYPAGTTAQRIAEELILDMATPVGRMIDLPTTAVTTTPWSINGNTFEKLERMLEGYDYEATIQNGSCYVMPRGKRLSSTSAYISEGTGLIGGVTSLDVSSKPDKVTDTTNSDNRYIRFTCQIDATLMPQNTVYVEDTINEVDGAYKIEKVRFECNSIEQGNFIAIVDAVEIDAVISS